MARSSIPMQLRYSEWFLTIYLSMFTLVSLNAYSKSDLQIGWLVANVLWCATPWIIIRSIIVRLGRDATSDEHVRFAVYERVALYLFLSAFIVLGCALTRLLPLQWFWLVPACIAPTLFRRMVGERATRISGIAVPLITVLVYYMP